MYLEESKTVVIKIGSSLLINNKIIREKWLSEFAKDVKHLQNLKKKRNIKIPKSKWIKKKQIKNRLLDI